MHAEIFSLAELPWGGVSEDEIMGRMQKLEKLGCPAMCPAPMYDIMYGCWRLEPRTRMSGAAVAEAIAEYAESSKGKAGNGSGLEWPEVTLPKLSFLQQTAIDLEDASVVAAFEALETAQPQFELVKELGKGQFGSVHLARLVRKDGGKTAIAVKMQHGGSGVPEAEQRQFMYEARLLSAIHHGHIVSVVAVHFGSSPQYIGLELMEGGELGKYLADFKAQVEENVGQLIGVCLQICDAMAYLEKSKIVHRDLAARNVLVSAVGLEVVKLSDVGLSRPLMQSEYYKKTSKDKVCDETLEMFSLNHFFQIPAKWMALESLLNSRYSHASDVWSFGVLCWEVFSFGARPYPG